MPVHPADLGTENYEEETALELLENEEHLLMEVNDALARIEQGTFGRCENCHKPISKERLDAMPYARYCIRCARKLQAGAVIEYEQEYSSETTMAETQLIRCPSCGQTNRVPMDKVASGLTPVCGRCKTRMPIESKPVTVSDATFSAEVERSPLPVLVDMWAPWCGPCRMIAPMIDELASDMAGRVRFAKLNIDENPATAERFHVRSIPTLLVLKAGREIDRIVGVQPKAEIARRLERVAG